MLPHLNLLARLSIVDLMQKPLTIEVRAALNVVTKFGGAMNRRVPPPLLS